MAVCPASRFKMRFFFPDLVRSRDYFSTLPLLRSSVIEVTLLFSVPLCLVLFCQIRARFRTPPPLLDPPGLFFTSAFFPFSSIKKPGLIVPLFPPLFFLYPGIDAVCANLACLFFTFFFRIFFSVSHLSQPFARGCSIFTRFFPTPNFPFPAVGTGLRDLFSLSFPPPPPFFV